MPPSMSSSCPVDEHRVGISISEDFQKMRREQSAKTIGNSQHRTRQSKLLCHWPYAVFSPESVVDNAANGALTLRVGSIRRPDPTARALALAGQQVESATAPSAPPPRWRGTA